MGNPVRDLRVVGWAEGISFLVLLGVAMPLKYAAGRPEMVQIVGGLHGGLFLLYLAAVGRAAWRCRWSLVTIAVAVLASFFPGGTFLLDGFWRRETARVAGGKSEA